jgi:transposase
MNKGIRFTDEFKQDAVAQVVERGYAVSEVAERLGISTKSLYTWKSRFSKSLRVRSEVADQAAEIRRLKRELARVAAIPFSSPIWDCQPMAVSRKISMSLRVVLSGLGWKSPVAFERKVA